MANEVRLIDVRMGENDINAKTVGEFLKALLLQLWEEAERFSSKRPFGNSDWQYQVYASLINAGYEIGKLDEDGYVETVDYQKADKLIEDAITAVFDPESLRPKGRWFLLDECSNAGVYCSVCTKKVYKEQYANQKLKSPYCPNCGAKMTDNKGETDR